MPDLTPIRSAPLLRRPRSLATLVLLAAGTLVRCDCEDEISFEARGVYEPEVLAFDAVNVAEQRVERITVRSTGSAGLQVVSAEVLDSDKFTVVVADDLLEGLAPGQTSTITVTYRPCPAAWSGNRPTEGYDLSTCPGAFDSAELVITDTTEQQTRSIPLSGQPVQPPNSALRCVVGRGRCNQPDAQRSDNCATLAFDDVRAGDEPCDLYVEVVNANRTVNANEVRVGPLRIDTAAISVVNSETGGMQAIPGPNAGFSLLAEDGSPLRLPIEIPVADGESEGSALLRVRFDGTVAGNFSGALSDMRGLRIGSNDPDNPTRYVTVLAAGTAPEIQVIDRRSNSSGLVDFGPVAQGRSATATIAITNQGNTELNISQAGLRGAGNPEFQFQTADGRPLAGRTIQPFASEEVLVYVRYTPADDLPDREFYDIESDDPNNNPFVVEIRGGPQPGLCPPPSVVEWPIDETTGPRTRVLQLASCGSGRLNLLGLRVENADNPSSLQDFRVDLPQCATLPCSLDVSLCPAIDPDCEIDGQRPGTTFDIPLIYENQDLSRTDFANLVIRTSDPRFEEALVLLRAEDNPCFPPTVSVDVQTMSPCASNPVQVRVVGDPGGPIGMPATLTECRWETLFGGGPNVVYSPNGDAAACVNTSFTPTEGGNMIILLSKVCNDCGGCFPAEGELGGVRETIPIAPECN